MKVKHECVAELRSEFLKYVKENVRANLVVGQLVRWLSVDELGRFIVDEYFEDFKHMFESISPSETESDKTIAELAESKDEALVTELRDAWAKVGLHDFGIPFFYEPSSRENFQLMCDDLEVLQDELDLKMNRFIVLANEILGFAIHYGVDEQAKDILTVHGKAKELKL